MRARALTSPRRSAFPFRIAKMQRAIPRCAYFYTLSWNARRPPIRIIRPVGRPTGQKKKRCVRGTHTEERLYRVLSASSSFLCSTLFRGNSFTEADRERLSRKLFAAFAKAGSIFLSPDESCKDPRDSRVFRLYRRVDKENA